MLEFFKDNFKFDNIIMKLDRSWNTIKEIEQFELIETTKPKFYYVVGERRDREYNYTKKRLLSNGCDETLTKDEIMIYSGYYKIYDSGNLKYSYLIKS